MSYKLGRFEKKTAANRLFKLLEREDTKYYFEDYDCGRFIRYIGNNKIRSHNIDTNVSKDEYVIRYEGNDSIMKVCLLSKDEYDRAIDIMKSKTLDERRW